MEKSEKIKNIPKFVLTGFSLTDGKQFSREVSTLDDVRESGQYTIIGRDVSEINGLPPAEYCDCKDCYIEAQLTVTRSSSSSGKIEKESIGQGLIISNKEDGSTNTYKRSWSAQHNNSKWTAWQMVATGDIELIKQNNEIEQAFTNLTNNLENETVRALEAEESIKNTIKNESSRTEIINDIINRNITVYFDRFEKSPTTINEGVADIVSEIVYYVPNNIFVAADSTGTYWNTWDGMEIYMSDGAIRKDKIYLCNEDIYICKKNSLVKTNYKSDYVYETMGIIPFEYGSVNVDNGILVDSTKRIRSKPIYFSKGAGTKTFKYSIPETLVPSFTAAGNRGAYAYKDTTPIKRVPNLVVEDGVATFTADGTFDNVILVFAAANAGEISQDEIEKSHIFNDVGLVTEVENNNLTHCVKCAPNTDFAIADEKGNILAKFENGGIKTKKFDSGNTLSICVIGNSYSLDSFMYLPFILLKYGIYIKLGIYYRPGGSLQNQVDEFANAQREFFYIDTEKHDAWQSVSATFCPQMALEFKKWDIIVIQQSSTDSISYDNFVPSARNLINLIMDTVSYPFKLGWNVNINRNASGTNYDEIETVILTNISKIVKREAVDIVFPYGTAVFNARTNSVLAAIGDGGLLWSDDKVHLQEGLPCYIANLANVQKLFEVYYPKFSVLNDKTIPTDKEVEKWGIQGIHGTSTGITESNCRLAQLCAIAANKHNFEIVNIEN